jgi:hypothetical protein
MARSAGSEDGSRAKRLERWDAAPRPVVTPSLLACDFNRMGEELAALQAAGFAGVQLDVMDGHFVPNLTYGPSLAAQWRDACELFFDAHLMMAEPQRYLDAFIAAGCDQIIIHIGKPSGASGTPAVAPRWPSTRQPRPRACCPTSASSTRCWS